MSILKNVVTPEIEQEEQRTFQRRRAKSPTSARSPAVPGGGTTDGGD